MYNAWARWVSDGARNAVTVYRIFARDLRVEYKEMLDRNLFEYADSIAWFAVECFGRKENGEPFWSNNERRRYGFGPMPVRGILRHRRKSR